jgi:hypothetical protein
VLSGTATPTAAVGTLGDFYIETDVSKIYGPKAASGANGGWGAGTDLKGEEGSPWTAGGTLPAGETLTGIWTATTTTNQALAPISFSIPLSRELDGLLEVHPIATGAAIPAACDDGVAPSPSVANPEAKNGHLCVFQGYTEGEGVFEIFKQVLPGPPPVTQGANQAGAFLLINNTTTPSGPLYMTGTYAVTGP